MEMHPDPPSEDPFRAWTRRDEKAQEECGVADGLADARAGNGWPDGCIGNDTPYTRGYARGRRQHEREKEG
jgi:hypothetical protein